MDYETTALMSFIDLLVICAFTYAFWVFQKHKKTVLVKELRADYFLIAVGLCVIGLFYAHDLICRNLPPAYKVWENTLFTNLLPYHEFEWTVVPAGVLLIALGFVRNILGASKIIAKLNESEGRSRKIGLETVSALSKLNEREVKLTVQNERFHAMVENLPQGICMYDDQQRLIVCNERYASIYGLSNNLLTPGTKLRQILDHRIKNNVFMGSDPEKYIEERLTAVALTTTSTKIHLLSDGRVFAIAHKPLAEGGWVGTHEDITEQAKAEAMNQRLARIIEDAINEVYVFDVETLKFLQVNSSACKNLGYTIEELYELTPLDLMSEFTIEEFNAHLSPLRNGEKKHILFETIHQRKDGSTYDVKITLQYIRSQNQHVFAAIIEDVTERKKAEAAIRQSEELFSKAFHANNVPFSISGPDGKIFDVNESWLTAFGYTREEVIGNSSLKLGIWADPDERAHFVEMLKKDGIVNNCETHYRTNTDELRDVVVSGEWVEVDGESRMFNISHDVTDTKAARRQLTEDRDHLQELVNEATADLKAKAEELEASLTKEKELNNLQRQFLSMASHEFRTPLAIIDSTAQRLKKSAGRISSDESMKRVDKIRNAVQRMTQLMESTLNAARLEDGKYAINLEPCSIKKAMCDACTNLQDLSKNHNITCEFKDLPETIKADTSALDQVLTNLLSNAIKYSPDAPDILIKGFSQDDDVIIQVCDNGIGIDEDDLPKMFGKFFRAKTSASIAGTGIGLNLTKTLVERHGGSISIESKLGKGSTITVRLPIAGPSQVGQAA